MKYSSTNRFGEYAYEPVHGSLQKNARSNFVSKVYTILSIQLTFTALTVIFNIVSPTFAMIQATYNSLWWLAVIGSIGPLLALCNIFNLLSIFSRY